MATMNSFKSYERGTRQQLTEENFIGGMSYRNVPLSESFLRLLVNFNISPDGDALTPREGLRTTLLTEPDVISSEAFWKTQREYTISASKVCFEGTERYDQIVLTYKEDDDYYCRILTVNEDGVQRISAPQSCRVRLPEKAEIHGVPISDVTPIRQQIGTFGFENSYFFFDGTGQLCLTSFDEDKKMYVVDNTEDPKDVTPPEAVQWGYNMLKEEPYKFSDATNEGEFFSFASGGIVLYEAGTAQLTLTQAMNVEYDLRVFYTGNVVGREIKIEWMAIGGGIWNPIKEFSNLNNGAKIEVPNFVAPAEHIMVRVTAMKEIPIEPEGTAKIVETASQWGFSFNDKVLPADYDYKTYSLETSQHIVVWKDRLVVAGVEEDSNILFTSQVKKFNYFPYPKNNVDFFNEPIRNLVPFLDSLLVFTSTKLFQLTLDEGGMHWTKICIQENLHIEPWDTHLTQVVKNMVFFKSGNYYYMIVPKANSLTGALTLAPITKNIKELLDDFLPSVRDTLNTMYDYTALPDLIHYYNFLDYEFIYNIYVFKTKEGLYINFCLLYNSVKRYWKINIYETQGFLHPLMQDATKTGTFVNVVEKEYNVPDTRYFPQVQYVVHDNEQYQDNLLDRTGKRYIVERFKNWQYLDTGNREHNAELKKRYRELQFRLENKGQRSLNFNVGFYIDGDTRKQYYRYSTVYNEETQEIYLAKELVDPLFIAGETVLNEWVLDTDAFPSTNIWKLRTPVSGKGYCPRVCFLSRNETDFALRNMSWVYRVLYSR